MRSLALLLSIRPGPRLVWRPAGADSIVLGGGCFWCMDAAYKLLPGVTHVTCGYAGGTTSNPTYEDVCTETTGHAEVVKVEYDPAKGQPGPGARVFFWGVARDPTQVGGQGADMGPSYRSIILYAESGPAGGGGGVAQAEAQKDHDLPRSRPRSCP